MILFSVRRYQHNNTRSHRALQEISDSTVKKSALKSYGKFLDEFQEEFSEHEVVSVTADDIGRFLEECAESLNRSTRHFRYAQLKAFSNYVIEVSDLNIKNPCNADGLCKAFKNVYHRPRKILYKKTVDEIIFNSRSVFNLPNNDCSAYLPL